MFITAIFKNVYYNGNKKSPWARSLNYAGNEYDFEYDFFQLLKNDENDILTICDSYFFQLQLFKMFFSHFLDF